ncbi:MAG: flippase-like domain-containing protein [Candidatus Hydrogenedentes bacterium]|nr:flippase-like domain-containing protein [Candidatus Hydrogenedentota bacterium]
MKRALQILIGVVVAGFLAWLLLRGVSFQDLRGSLGKMHWGWMLLAQAPIWASFWLRIQRWSYVVRAVHPATFRAMFSSTQLAFLVNFTIGMRLGELVRPLVLSRLTRMTFAKAMAVNTLDRVNDLIGLIVVMLVGVVAFRPDHDIVLPKGTFGIAEPITISKSIVVTGGEGSALFLAVVLGSLVLIYLNQKLMLRITNAVVGLVSRKLAAFTCHLIEQFADGLHVFRNVGDLTKSVTFSLATWSCFLLSYVLFFEAFGLDYPWYAAFIVQILLAFSVSAPGVPGMVGQFHIPIVVGMLMAIPNAPLPDCVALAIVAHISNMIPITCLGAYALFIEGLSLAELRHEVEDAEVEVERLERPAQTPGERI